MIPYIELRVIRIGPVNVPVYGVLLVAAIAVARWRVLQHAKAEAQFRERDVATLCLVMLVVGMFCAHVGKLAMESTSALFADPMMALRTTQGIRSAGGLFGGLAAGICWCRISRFSTRETLRLLESIAFVLPLSWLIGRIGCALTHDHIGRPSNGWLAVAFSDGGRYDLGVIEVFFLIGLTTLFWRLSKRPRPTGFYFGCFGVLYGAFRMLLDTLQIHPFGPGFQAGIIGVMIGLLGWACGVYLERRPRPYDRKSAQRSRCGRVAQYGSLDRRGNESCAP